MMLLRSSSLALLVTFALAACSSRDVPQTRDTSVAGWFLSGPRMQGFRISVDREVHFAGAASGRLESTERGSGAGTMMQSVSADAYRGKRVRFSAVVRTRNVEGWTGLWMRVERPDGRIAFDNMQQRPLRRSTEWTRVEVVLDVALDATAIAFGLLQDGNGVSWIDEAALEPVGKDVAVTAIDPVPRALRNVDFESTNGSSASSEPHGWLLQGIALDDFVVTRDTAEKHGGNASAKLANKIDTPRGQAYLVQSIRADDYAGTRVRVSAWVKAENVERGGFFAVNTYAADAGPLSPGLTSARCGLGPTSEWKQCEGVIDVPSLADTLQVTLGLEGKGTAWIDDVRLTPVGLDVPLTHVDRRSSALVNGDVEAKGKTPDPWFLSGGARAHYDASVDTSVKHGGKQSARLEPRVKDPQGYGTMMQGFRAHDFRGKRLRMNAFVKGNGIDGRGDLWMRVQAADSPGDGSGLGGGHCTLSGTFDWKPCTLVLDVPERGDEIHIGVGLDAHGTLWLDDVTFEVVDTSVELTSKSNARRTLEDGGFETAKDSARGWFISGGAL
ncbi:MAG: Transcriptional regulator, AraC family protein, partial [Labilithrix sp.]|nr:Transcriptional regulator, AraC family protein [Labilithrix sp.]